MPFLSPPPFFFVSHLEPRLRRHEANNLIPISQNSKCSTTTKLFPSTQPTSSSAACRARPRVCKYRWILDTSGSRAGWTYVFCLAIPPFFLDYYFHFFRERERERVLAPGGSFILHCVRRLGREARVHFTLSFDLPNK